MKKRSQFTIKGKGDNALAQERGFGLYRPCPCGCDKRDGDKGVGYLHGIKDGTGVTVWIETEDVYQALGLFVRDFGKEGGA